MNFLKFSIEVPTSWEEENLRIEDSYVGGIKLSNDEEVVFDLGYYSNRLDEVDSLTHNFSWIIIDGRKTKLVTPKKPGQGTVGIYIDSLWVNGSFGDDYMIDTFVMGGNNLKAENERLLIKAFTTLEFKKN